MTDWTVYTVDLDCGHHTTAWVEADTIAWRESIGRLVVYGGRYCGRCKTGREVTGCAPAPDEQDPNAHPDGLIVISEIKTLRGRTTADQDRWLDTLNGAELHSYLWTPDDWPYIEQLLTRRLT